MRKMLNEEVIEPSKNAWSIAPVAVRKSNGELRFYVDYRDVNELEKMDACPIPNMDAISGKHRHARFISKIDLIHEVVFVCGFY